MSGQPEQELRALLFGQEDAGRQAAPEPALLELLAPLLPESLLPYAFSLATHIWDYGLRSRVLRVLIDRAASPPDPIGRLSSIMPLDLLQEMLPQLVHLSPEQVLEAVLAPDDEWDRKELLLAIIPELPEEMIGRLQGMLEHILSDIGYRCEVMVALAPRLSDSEREALLQETVRQARAAPPQDRDDALNEIAPALRDLGHAELALQAALALESEAVKADLLASLAPHLSEANLKRGLSAARRFRDEETRIATTLALAGRLPAPKRSRILEERRAETLAIRDRTERSVALGRLAPHLARAGLTAAALDAARRMRRGDRRLGEVLAAVAPCLALSELEATLELTAQLPRVGPRFDALRGLLPRLAELGRTDTALDMAGDWSGERQATLLAELLPHVPPETRPNLLARALQALDDIGDVEERAGHVVELASRLADLGYPEGAMQAASATNNEAYGARAYLRILPTLPTELRSEAVERARYLAPVIRDQRERTLAVGQVASYLAGSAQEEVLGWTRDMLRHLDGEWQRASVAARLIESLPADAAERLARQIAEPAGEEAVSAAGISSARLAALLDELSPAASEQILTETLSRIRERYAGGESDMQEVPASAIAGEILSELSRKQALVGRPRMEDDEEALLTADDDDIALPVDEELVEERVVSTGFAADASPADPLEPDFPLATDAPYWFWLEVGEPVAGSIEITPTDLPAEAVPAGALLQVALFGFPGEIEITPAADVGELQLLGRNTVRVVRQPAEDVPASAEMLEKRLFFPIRTPAGEGVYRLRCNIYYGRMLIQSRLVRARARRQSRPEHGALQSTVDFTLTHSLEPAGLAHFAPHRLSLIMNDSGRDTHGFHFFGADNFKNSAFIDGQGLQHLIDIARGSLRKATWGSEADWSGEAYRYDTSPDLGRLAVDLLDLARKGYDLYDAIINDLAGSSGAADTLAELMRTPGVIQIALVHSARHYVPAALIYDHPLDTDVGDYSLCPTFKDAFQGAQSLEDCACFQGECPSRGDDTVVCPSGFWGFRHALGLPLSINAAPDLTPEIPYRENPRFAVCVWAGPDFTQRADHEAALQALPPGLSWSHAVDRGTVFTLLLTAAPHVVYFYCHGGVKANGTPYIQVGSPAQRGLITRSNIRSKGIRWGVPAGSPRPLVFINGCHTTALEPETALDFVGAFVENAAASGVMGTEITVFEPLACAFGEEFMRRLLAGSPVGEAVRGARLALLKAGNPLGLAYVPFATADLKLVKNLQE